VALVLVGLNHRTASVELREKLSLSGCALRMALEDLRNLTLLPDQAGHSRPAASEAVIVSTCNRLEVYASVSDTNGVEAIECFLGQLQNVAADELVPHLYHYTNQALSNHLMRVTCGLESMILGETQILGQVTRAFEEAHAADMTGPYLSHLFAQAIHTGKRARTETVISHYTTSVSHAGTLKVIEELSPSDRRILVVGTGEMAVLAADALKRFDRTELGFINRTYSRAETLAEQKGGRTFAWHQLEEALVWADAVICATGAPHTVIYRRDMEAALPKREGRRLVIVDIAIPRDVEDDVRELSGVRYYDIDNLQAVVDTNWELRKAAVPQVEAIIQQEMLQFEHWYHSRSVVPVIKDLRSWAQEIAAEELEETLNHLPDADERTQKMVSRLAHRLVNRWLHEPTTRLRLQAAEGNGYSYAQAIRELFALDDQEPASDEPIEVQPEPLAEPLP